MFLLFSNDDRYDLKRFILKQKNGDHEFTDLTQQCKTPNILCYITTEYVIMFQKAGVHYSDCANLEKTDEQGQTYRNSMNKKPLKQ